MTLKSPYDDGLNYVMSIASCERVFFSYSRKDAEIVKRYRYPLFDPANPGERYPTARIWMDDYDRRTESLPLSTDLLAALLEASILCVFSSINSYRSEWVTEEIRTFCKPLGGYWDVHLPPLVIVVALPGTPQPGTSHMGFAELLLSELWLGAGEVITIDGADFDEASSRLRKILGEIGPRRIQEQLNALGMHNREEIAVRYWKSTLPRELNWREANPCAILQRFPQQWPDHFAHSEWWQEGLNSLADLMNDLQELLDLRVWGTNLTSLFSEVLGRHLFHHSSVVSAGGESQILSVQQQVPDPWFPGSTVRLRTNPDNLGATGYLCYLGSLRNFSNELLWGYYYLRKGTADWRSTDALDLTVLITLGYILDRWELMNCHWEFALRRMLEPNFPPEGAGLGSTSEQVRPIRPIEVGRRGIGGMAAEVFDKCVSRIKTLWKR